MSSNLISFYNDPAVSGPDVNGWGLVFDGTTGKASFWDGSNFSNSTASALNDGSWHHVAAVADNTQLMIYVDGALDSTHTISSIPSYSGPGAIGADGECEQEFTGTIDEVAVWRSALTAEDIQSIYGMALAR